MVLIIPQGFLFGDEQVSIEMCLENRDTRFIPEGFKRGIFELSCNDPQSPILRHIQLSDMTCITLPSWTSIVHLALHHTMVHGDKVLLTPSKGTVGECRKHAAS